MIFRENDGVFWVPLLALSWVILIEFLEEKLDFQTEFWFDYVVWQEIEDFSYYYALKEKNSLYLRCELSENALL